MDFFIESRSLVKKSIARTCGNPDGKGECGVRAAKTLASGGEQGGNRAVRRNSITGEPPREWGVPREEGRIDGAVLAMHGVGEQDQGGEGTDHEGAGGADGGLRVEHGGQVGVRGERAGGGTGGEGGAGGGRRHAGAGGDRRGWDAAAEGNCGGYSLTSLQGL